MRFRGKFVLEADSRLVSDVLELWDRSPFAFRSFGGGWRRRPLAHPLAKNLVREGQYEK